VTLARWLRVDAEEETFEIHHWCSEETKNWPRWLVSPRIVIDGHQSNGSFDSIYHVPFMMPISANIHGRRCYWRYHYLAITIVLTWLSQSMKLLDDNDYTTAPAILFFLDATLECLEQAEAHSTSVVRRNGTPLIFRCWVYLYLFYFLVEQGVFAANKVSPWTPLV
jgi:hypothetical protein